MYWTLELAYRLEDAPWPATKEELIDYATRSGAPLEVVENLEELEDDGEIYESIEDIWLSKSLRMTARFTKASKTSGPITPQKTTFSSTRKNIN